MFRRILNLAWSGFWQGVGLEVSFLMLWVVWHFLHEKVAHKFDPEHLFHKIHDYFTN
jgi:hypothetical protein